MVYSLNLLLVLCYFSVIFFAIIVAVVSLGLKASVQCDVSEYGKIHSQVYLVVSRSCACVSSKE